VSIVLPIQLLTALEVNVAAQSLKATLALKAKFLKKYFRVFAHLPVDIPECVRGLDECDTNATCINTVGSYDCMCNTGFTGSGFMCTGLFSLC